jgi:hypothetical protein
MEKAGDSQDPTDAGAPRNAQASVPTIVPAGGG